MTVRSEQVTSMKGAVGAQPRQLTEVEMEMVRGGAEPIGNAAAAGVQAGVQGVAAPFQALGSAFSKGK